MYKNLKNIFDVIYFDETLLRLLYYSPKSLKTNNPDPLDSSLSNVLTIDTNWTIRNLRIKKTPKVDDLNPDYPLCRILIYVGRRSPDTRNYLTASQELIIDTVVHDSFEEGDLRYERISDRLNELFVAEEITGIGKFGYVAGGQITGLPSSYVGFKNIYKFGSMKK